MSVHETKKIHQDHPGDMLDQNDAQLILDALPMGIFWKDMQGHYGGANQVALDHAKLSSAQCLHKSDSQMPWKNNLESIQKIDEIILSANKPFELESMPEFYLSRPDFNYYLKMPWQRQNQLVGIIGIAIQIKNRPDYQKTNDEVEEIVRHALLSCSHDILLPINAVVGNLQMARFLLRKNKINETLQVMDKINRSITALLAVFHQLSNSTTKSQKQRFALLTLTQNEVELARSLIKPKQELEIAYMLNALPNTYIYSNLYLFSQIIRNLLSNAVRYTSKGLINLKISIIEADAHFNHMATVSIVVQDTGCGLTPEVQAQFLAPLHHAADYTRRSAGIDIIRGNVSLLKGTLDIPHTSAAGTMIVVTIPCVISFRN